MSVDAVLQSTMIIIMHNNYYVIKHIYIVQLVNNEINPRALWQERTKHGVTVMFHGVNPWIT